MLSLQQTRGSAQSYCGTRGYIAPELFQDSQESIDFVKCDVWALALLVLETLIGGLRYFDSPDIMFLIQERAPSWSNSLSEERKNNELESESSQRPGYDIFTISDSLFQMASSIIDLEFQSNRILIHPMSQTMVKQIFRKSLQVDPSKRCGDVSRLPFTYSLHKPSNIADMTKQPVVKIGGVNMWEYEVRVLNQTSISALMEPQIFRPENVVAVPHETKTRILSDINRAAMGDSIGRSAQGDPMLCLAMAHAVGYGVKPDYNEFYKFVRKSVENGSHIASLILACLSSDDKRRFILQAFSDVMNDSHSENQATCKLTRQTSKGANLISLQSVDGCNWWHYLPLFDALRNGVGDHFAITKRQNFEILTNDESQDRVNRLTAGISHLKHNQPNALTSTIHYIHPHFPFCLEGTPLSFAVSLGCYESVQALLVEGASPLEPLLDFVTENRTASTLQPKLALTSALHTAVACHQSRIFKLLWSSLGPPQYLDFIADKDDIRKELIDSDWVGSSIMSALAQQSGLERMLIHGEKRQLAQTDMINTLLEAFGQVAVKSLPVGKRLPHMARLTSKGVQGILALGDLDIATEIMAALSRDGPGSYHYIPRDLEDKLRRDIVDDALRIACSGSLDPARFPKYLQFARDVGVDTNVDAIAIKMMMHWKADRIFWTCLDDGLDLQSADEEGRNALHHSITSRFCERFPSTELLMRHIDVNAADHEGNTPLHMAALLGLRKTVQQLLSNNAVPTTVNKQGSSILQFAVLAQEGEKIGIVEDIIHALESPQGGSTKQKEQKVDFHYGNAQGISTKDRKSILHLAIASQNLEITKILLGKGVNVNVADVEGKVPLHYAIDIDEYALSMCFCSTLLDAGADPLRPDNYGRIPLHEAALRSHADPYVAILECFAECGPSAFDARDRAGQSLLHQAVQNVADNCVGAILKLGASPHIQNLLGQNALHICAQVPVRDLKELNFEGEPRLMRIADILLNFDVDLFVQDQKNDYTPFEYLAMYGNEPLLRHLVSHVRHSTKIQTQAYFKSKYQRTLSSTWSLAVKHEQMAVVGAMFNIDPSFQPDLSLLDAGLGTKVRKFLRPPEGRMEKWFTMTYKQKNARWQELILKYNRQKADLKGRAGPAFYPEGW